jgi:hydrogenase expression/formation protein HypE
VQALFSAGIAPHCLRDLTRGGLASALHEIARDGGVKMTIEEEAIAIPELVQGMGELLGLDPLYVANEGRMVLFVPPHQADRTLAVLHQFQPEAAIIGTVGDRSDHPWVSLRSGIGGERLLDLLSGEQLPRIC